MEKEKIFEILLGFFRPKYYNKITWTVVLAGISLVSTSVVEILLNEILKIKFHVNIISEQDGLYGVILVFLGLTYNVSFHFVELKREELGTNTKKENNDKNLAHDSKIFEASDKILNEDELDTILDQLYGGHETYLDYIKKIWGYNGYFKLKSNKFLTEELSVKNEVFSKVLRELSEFIATKFFSAKHSETIFQMHPELNWDKTTLGVTEEGEKRYTKFTQDLNELIKRVDQTYGEYRETIKEILKV